MINTVTGRIDASELGVTYIHDHLYVIPNALARYYDYTLDDVDKSIAESIDFKNHGGKTIVDLTPINYGRNPLALRKISEGADINVCFVTGFHKEEFMPKWIDDLTDDEIYKLLVREITEGVSSKHILPAAMKAGTSYNTVTEDEKRILTIEGHVQHDTHIPMVTHCDKGTMALEQVKLLKRNGADLQHVCLSHLDLQKDVSYIEAVCDTGASVSFDHVGRELANKDIDRIKMLSKLVKDGYSDHICLAGDMGRKKYFLSYNGQPGLKYIITTFKERLVPEIGEKEFNKMVIDNPRRILDV